MSAHPGRYLGKVVIVTAAGSGIGRAIAVRCRDEGATVVANDLDPHALEQLAGPRTHWLAGDVEDPELAENLVALARSVGTGRVDALFNNAGISRTGPPEDVPMAEWRRVLGVNLDAAFRMTQVVGRAMITQGSGAILNTASTAGLFAIPNRVAYVVSKHGLVGLTRALAIDWGPHGVRVNALCPGLTATGMNEQVRATDPTSWTDRESSTPLRRAGTPDDQAALALFLNSDDAAYLTGQISLADGGQHALYAGHAASYGTRNAS